jgi:hypothetical protein
MEQLSLFDYEPPLTLPAIAGLFADSFQELKLGKVVPDMEIEFFSFVGINHTIRVRNEGLAIRISDLFQDASRRILKAVSIILLCKLYRRRIHPQARMVYEEFIRSGPIKEKALEVRCRRGRKMLAPPKGQYFDLAMLFERLNVDYFGGSLPKINLGWSLKKSRRILGHFDPSHLSITITRWFDRPGVPEYVVNYVLCHEMLHARFATSSNFDLRNKHGHCFKTEEKKYPFYRQANDWLKQHC